MASPRRRCSISWCSACANGSNVDIDGSVYHRSGWLPLAATTVEAQASVIGTSDTGVLVDLGIELRNAHLELTVEQAKRVGLALAALASRIDLTSP